jgi:hypothetical protein
MARKSNLDCPKDQFGPIYNINAGAAFRRREGALASWAREDRQAYGAAIEAAVLASQAAALRREVTEQRPNCASRSWANAPGEVGEVVRRQHAAALAACPSQVRRSRTPQEWESLYVDAMPKGFVPSWEREEVQAAMAA